MSLNKELAQQFEYLLKYWSRQKSNKVWRFKVMAYANAIRALTNLNFKVTSVNQIRDIPDIGAKTRAKIREFLETGKIEEVEAIKPEVQQEPVISEEEKVLNKFKDIYGVGVAEANRLYKLGMRSLEDLQNNLHLLNDNQKIGLRYYGVLLEKIPRRYITIFKYMLMFIFNLEFGLESYRMVIAGSYRRLKPESGDIDCLLTSNVFDLSRVVNVLKKWNVIVEVLGVEHEKGLFIAHCPTDEETYIRFDIEFIPEEQWIPALLYFTGSKFFNIRMRGIAKNQGYTLNQKGLFVTETGEKVKGLETEEDYFKALGMNYLPPEKR